MKQLLFTLVLGVACVLPHAAAANFAPLNPNQPIILVSDAMPDDYYALMRLAMVCASRNRGKDLLVVAVDGETDEKARAFHNLLYFFGANQAKVVAGNPNVIDPNDPLRIEYPEDYNTPELRALFNALASSTEPAPWVKDEYRASIKRFVSTRKNIQVVHIGNPLSFVDVQEELDPSRFKFSYRNAFWKKGPGGRLILAFNGNRNVRATQAHNEWCIKHGVPTLDLPSDLLADFGAHDGEVAEIRAGLMASPEHESVLGDLSKSLGKYTSAIQHTLLQKHGPLASYIYIFDPRKKGWFQDTIFLEAILNGGLFDAVHGTAKMDLTGKDPQGLGFFVDITSATEGPHLIVTKLHLANLAEQMAQGLKGIQVTPTFNPARAISNRTSRPLVQIFKGANDDEGALMAGLALGDTQLVIAESSRSAELARRYQRTLEEYRLPDVTVVAGRGHTWEQMADPVTALSMEKTIAEGGGLSKGLLTAEALAEINKVDPSTLSAARELKKFLETHDNVVIHDTASGETLYEVLQAAPQLARKIAEYHMMGGFRKPPAMSQTEFSDGAKGFRGGEVTRCWKNTKTVERLLAILAQYQVNTWVASSHHTGGNADDNTMPLYTEALAKREAKYEVARIQRGLRLAWNEPLRGKIPVETSLGPPLGYVQAARIALGADYADTVFSATRGKFVFKGDKVDFIPDDSSSIRMLDLFGRFNVLDQTMTHLAEIFDQKLARRIASPPSCVIPLVEEGRKPKP